ADQSHHILQQSLVFASTLGGNQNAGKAVMGRRDDTPFAGDRSGEDKEAVLLQFASNFTYALTGYGIGLDVTMNDEDGKFQVFVHGGFLRALAFRAEAPRTSSKQSFETLLRQVRFQLPLAVPAGPRGARYRQPFRSRSDVPHVLLTLRCWRGSPLSPHG